MSTTTQPRTESAPQTVPDPLRHKLEQIAKLFDGMNAVDIENRWRIGKDIVAIERDEKKYGKHAVNIAASHLGVGRDVLYDAARVFRAWPRKPEVNELIAMRSIKGGRPLQFSHLVVIAGGRDLAEQDRLLQLWKETGCSVRDLKSAAKDIDGETDTPEEVIESPQIAMLDEFAVVTERGHRDMDRFLEVVIPALETAGGLTDDRARRRVHELRHRLIQLRKRVDLAIDKSEAMVGGELSERSDDLGGTDVH